MIVLLGTKEKARSKAGQFPAGRQGRVISLRGGAGLASP